MNTRNQRGSLAEFAPAFVVFTCFILIPLINFSAIPVRYLITQGVMTATVQKLALAESRTQAQTILDEGSWQTFLSRCGVTVHPQPLKLVVCGKNDGDKLALNTAQAVPTDYLPRGTKGPCVYEMELTVDADLRPLYPGAPATMKIACRAPWENLSRDPATHKYFINE